MSNIKRNTKTSVSKSDVDFYKMSGVFAIACIFVVLTLRMYNTITLRHSSGANITYNFYMLCRNPVFVCISAIIALAAVGWYAYCRIKNTDESMRIFSSTDAVALALYISVFYACFGIEMNSTRHMFFLTFTIAACALYYISRIFHIDFMFYTVMNAVFVLTIYAFASQSYTKALIVKGLLVVVAAVMCVLFRKKFSGSTKNTKKNKNAKKYLFFPVYISLALWAVALFWKPITMNTALFLHTNAMLVIMLVQYLIAGIVYTIRLIRE